MQLLLLSSDGNAIAMTRGCLPIGAGSYPTQTYTRMDAQIIQLKHSHPSWGAKNLCGGRVMRKHKLVPAFNFFPLS